MNVLRKAGGLAGAFALVVSPTIAWAASATTIPTITVTATIATTASISTDRDGNSDSVGTKDSILFDRLDINDGQVDGNPDFMYAPYRSKVGKNYHILRMFGNGGTTSLTAAVTGSVGAVALNTLLDVFCGGYFPNAGGGPVGGTPSLDWELLQTFSRSTGPFFGIAPMNYRLRVAGVASGSYAGTVTYTLTSN